MDWPVARGRGCRRVAVLLAAVGLFRLGSSEVRADDRPREDAPADVSKAVGDALQRLVDARQDLGENAWAAAMRDLIQLGPPAVPVLTKLLDETDDQYRMRCIVFALRGIGEKRVIPVLIRTIPKTLQPPMSDYGLSCDDAELMAFLRRHDNDFEDLGGVGHYSFGRPVTEVMRTLEHWTGHTDGIQDICFVHRQGAVTQLAQQERLYLNVARRWAQWWAEHWREYVDDPALAKVEIPEPVVPPDLTGIPYGPGVKAAGAMSGVIASVLERDDTLPKGFFPLALVDIDTGRFVRWPEFLPPAGEIAGREAELEAWAAREGIDLMGTQYRPPGSDKPLYILKPFGMRAWRIEDRRYETLEAELQNAQVRLGVPADGYLADYDAATNTFHPERKATFLFITREGTCGVLQSVCQVTKRARIGDPAGDDEAGLYFGVKVNTKVLFVDDALEPGAP